MVDNEVRPGATQDDAVDVVNSAGVVRTVLGPVALDELGVVAVNEALLSVVPGAEYAYDIVIDRAEIFDQLAERLRAFKAAGGGTVVDATGMFHGRDVTMLEALAKATGVHIVASTGMGPEENLGGYFLTPQTNPPTPWPAERFADLFANESTEGMVVARRERRGPAGIVITAGTRGGLTPTDESLYRGAARAGIAADIGVIFQPGLDAVAELDLILAEGISPARVAVGGADRREFAHQAAAVAERGSSVLIDHIASNDETYLSDAERADLVAELVAAGHRDRVLLSASAVGVAKGHEGNGLAFETVLTDFAPLLISRGVAEQDVRHILTANPAALLAVKEA